jgi:peptide/nickel transport system permease protein
MSVELLSEAQQAMQRGEKTYARRILRQVLLSDKHNEQAWLMMARLVDNQQQVVECLEWAYKINPQNSSTRAALVTLKRKSLAKVVTLTTPSHGKPHPSAVVDTGVRPSQLKLKESLAKPIDLSKMYGQEIASPHRKVNWSLIIGSLIILFVVLIATIGPRIAPQDPMEEHAILQIGKEWFIPPFNAFEVQGYILGSDEFGRDLLSRVLYGVRPTLIMVIIVSIVRLILGTLIGLGAGWSNGRIGRILDAMISAALAVPILIVALVAIAMLGAEIGLMAFIVGLSINGWGETARFVREQTRLIKGQLYIESAHAMGASSFEALTRHVLRQIMPMVWMLFAFEISGTLMVTAGLGFLGYFIGGDVWMEVADFVSRRTSGAPELGQMLATSWVNLLQPWPLVLTGSVIFITVLGFNLLGDGLRSRLNPEYINRNSPFALLTHRLGFWFEQSINYPVSNWFRANRLRPILVITAFLVLIGSIYLYETRIANLFNPALAAVTIPGGHIWASERIDPYGTNFLNSFGPTNAKLLWVVHHPIGFAGSPAISKDGTIYVSGLDFTLMALNPDGTTRWKTGLPEIPLGPLAIGPQGMIYVTDTKGGLSAFSSDGNLLWTYQTEVYGKPNNGPIISLNGTIYYLQEDFRGDTLFALLPNGELLWSMQPGTRSANTGLRLSPDEQQVFVKNTVVSTHDGSIVDITLPTKDNPVLENRAELFVGADGKTYLLAGHVVMQWSQTSQGFKVEQSAEWNYRGAGISQTSGLPVDAGVTPKGDIWLFYSGFYGGTAVYWLDPTGKILGNFPAPFFEGTHLVSVDGSNISFICGIGATEQVEYTTMCMAYKTDSIDPLWSYLFGADVGGIVGAAMAPGRLYVITGNGSLTALGDASTISPTPSTSP